MSGHLGDVEDRGSAWPRVVWWWDRSLDAEVPPTWGIRWVELVDDHESRSGAVPVSKQTADPTDLDDPAVSAELHYQLERHLGTMIRVDHASRHLDALGIERRLAVRGWATVTVAMDGVDLGVLGGLAVQPANQRRMVVVRADLGPNLRDGLLLWAETEVASLDSDELESWEVKGWTRVGGGWQLIARS